MTTATVNPVAAAVSMESALAPEQQRVMVQIDRIVQIFKHSNAVIRPHFLLTGPSGSGKSHLVQYLAEQHKMHFKETLPASEEEVMAVLDFAPETVPLTPEQELDILGEPDFSLPEVPKRVDV